MFETTLSLLTTTTGADNTRGCRPTSHDGTIVRVAKSVDALVQDDALANRVRCCWGCPACASTQAWDISSPDGSNQEVLTTCRNHLQVPVDCKAWPSVILLSLSSPSSTFSLRETWCKLDSHTRYPLVLFSSLVPSSASRSPRYTDLADHREPDLLSLPIITNHSPGFGGLSTLR